MPRPISPTTAQRIHATLRAALNAAVKADELPRNVAVSAVVPRGTRPRVRPWTAEQLGEFLDAIADERLYALYHLAAFTGLRRGEVCGLSWDDVDLDRSRLTVRWQHATVGYRVVRSKPKTRDSEEVTIDLDDGTVAVLKAWRTQQRKERLKWGPVWDNPFNLVFTKANGDEYHPDYVYDTFVRLTRRVGLRPIPLHHLRHGAASLQIEAGVDIAVISKRLRHSTIALLMTSDTYGHLIGRAGKQAAEAAAALVPRNKTGNKQAGDDPQDP